LQKGEAEKDGPKSPKDRKMVKNISKWGGKVLKNTRRTEGKSAIAKYKRGKKDEKRAFQSKKKGKSKRSTTKIGVNKILL